MHHSSAIQSKRTVNCISIVTEKKAKNLFYQKGGILLGSAQLLIGTW